MNARPMLVGTDSWNTYPDITYNNRDLWDIWTEMLKASHINNTGYRFDVINVGRQVLGNLFSSFRDHFTQCYSEKDIDGMKKWADQMDSLLIDTDRLLSCETNFSIGKWIDDARSFGKTEAEKEYYEENARCILTVWGQKATQLNDYANRGWGGLTYSYYRERWKRFTTEVITASLSGQKFDEKQFYQSITDFEYEWTLSKEHHPIISGENPILLAKTLSEKYMQYFY